MKAAKAIPDAGKRAEIYANIATAIATTGLVTGSSAEEVTRSTTMGSEDVASMERAKHEAEAAPKKKAEKAEKKADAKTDAKKALKQTPDKTVDDEVKEETPQWTTEWTEEAMEAFADELNTLETKIAEYGEELDEAVKEFSSEKYKSVDDLNPLNIRAFLAYLESLESSDEEVAG
jgi:hypothetical protein